MLTGSRKQLPRSFHHSIHNQRQNRQDDGEGDVKQVYHFPLLSAGRGGVVYSARYSH
jgi:hypothetical protein